MPASMKPAGNREVALERKSCPISDTQEACITLIAAIVIDGESSTAEDAREVFGAKVRGSNARRLTVVHE
ncbi:hypothetical protein L227DRAFT_581157 [Lentinus tigrinus ALCF2SS1-6]|uniref:Uncharacterized protein n=1 Tax=Lentinus tigrinus ALCF2SS1-6 TaxID=1328759 RepID=A0A5C2RQ38_9APHY|nr:hypothetical protein L227DRAFT_581157 [Lentinus tigrinus ALCF2SS1-6]